MVSERGGRDFIVNDAWWRFERDEDWFLNGEAVERRERRVLREESRMEEAKGSSGDTHPSLE